jgi:hypothetical protein
MANTKLSAFFSLLLVFCSGIAVGSIGYRVYTTNKNAPPVRPQDPKRDPEARRRELIAEDTRELHLSPDQVDKLQKVYDHTRERFHEANGKFNADVRAAWDDQIAQIKSFLSPEQIVAYDKLRAKRQAERDENDKKGHHKGGPSPGTK